MRAFENKTKRRREYNDKKNLSAFSKSSISISSFLILFLVFLSEFSITYILNYLFYIHLKNLVSHRLTYTVKQVGATPCGRP